MIELSSPLWIAAGPWSIPDGVDKSVIGAYTTKSVTPEPREGNSGQVFAKVEGGYINRMGLPSPGIDKWAETYESIGVPTFVSLALFDETNIEHALDIVKQLPDVVGVEINVSCPNVRNPLNFEFWEFGKTIKDTGLLSVLKVGVGELSTRTGLHRGDRGNFDAVVIGNAHPAVVVEDGVTIEGGLSGPIVKHTTMQKVKYAAERLYNLDIVACGGVKTGQDVADYLRMGAKYVQVGSAHISEPDCTTRIMAEYLELKAALAHEVW